MVSTGYYEGANRIHHKSMNNKVRNYYELKRSVQNRLPGLSGRYASRRLVRTMLLLSQFDLATYYCPPLFFNIRPLAS